MIAGVECGSGRLAIRGGGDFHRLLVGRRRGQCRYYCCSVAVDAITAGCFAFSISIILAFESDGVINIIIIVVCNFLMLMVDLSMNVDAQ